MVPLVILNCRGLPHLNIDPKTLESYLLFLQTAIDLILLRLTGQLGLDFRFRAVKEP